MSKDVLKDKVWILMLEKFALLRILYRQNTKSLWEMENSNRDPAYIVLVLTYLFSRQ